MRLILSLPTSVKHFDIMKGDWEIETNKAGAQNRKEGKAYDYGNDKR